MCGGRFFPEVFGVWVSFGFGFGGCALSITNGCWHVRLLLLGVKDLSWYIGITTIMENQMEKKMENEMDTKEYVGVIILGLYIGIMEKKMETIGII